MGSQQPLHRAIAKYGEEAFSHEVLTTCATLEEANDTETGLIAFYGSNDLARGYNLDAGGKSHNSNEESKRKIGEASKAMWAAMTPDERAAHIAKLRHEVTPEELERRRGRWAAMTHEERRAAVVGTATPEQLSERARRAAAAQTPEHRHDAAVRASVVRMETTTPEQRSESLKVGWATRRAEVAAACPAPRHQLNLLRLPAVALHCDSAAAKATA